MFGRVIEWARSAGQEGRSCRGSSPEAPPCKGKRQYLLTLQVSRYWLLPLRSGAGARPSETRTGCERADPVIVQQVRS